MLVAEHIQPLVSGGAGEGHWLLDLFSELPIPRQGAWLSLNCGGGGLEFLATQRGLFATLDGAPTYTPADLRRLSLALGPMLVGLVIAFALTVWPLLGLPLTG